MRIAEVSLPAIRHNIRHLRRLTGGAVIAVVKANGYGHGAEVSARAAIEAGAALIGVADLEEALALRESGFTERVMFWLYGIGVDFDAAVAAELEVGVSHVEQLEALAAAAQRADRTVDIQFKLDTGLSRNGASAEEWAELFNRGAELERGGAVRIRGIFSHLANAGDDNDRAQAAKFDEAVALLRATGVEPEMIHLASSAAALTSPHLHYNTVRVGMAIYGLSPYADRTSADLGLVPAMTLKSEIISLRPVPAGSGVSYGFNHVTQSDTTLAVVPMGYADGMPRALNGAGATVSVAGKHCPIVGRIGMDQCIVDLGTLGKRVRLGDPVILFGDPRTGVPAVELWSELLQTINYEVVAGIGPRVLRVPVDHEGERSDPIRLEISEPDRMHELGVELGRVLAAGDLVILTGPLGAGKTTLTRGIGEGLGVRGAITSPTFVLARTHPSVAGGPPLIHVDAYRLSDAAEADDLDLDFDGSVVVAEWGSGLIRERDSWIEISIERPVGADAAPAHGSTAAEAGAPADQAVDDAPVEPRSVTLAGHGTGWARIAAALDGFQ